MSPRFERVAVVGLGLLGGSVALAARRRGLAREVVGLARRGETAREALALGAVDAASDRAEEVLPGASLVVLATPLEGTAATVQALARFLDEGAVVTDVGSVKGALVEQLPGLLPPGVVFVGAHPLAGSHHRGLGHAREDLFEGAVCVVTPTAETPPDAVAQVRDFWEGLGARVLERSPEQHDAEVAWVSHVPHAVAFAFASALEQAPAGAGAVRGTGFQDFTRIARADPELWADILVANRKQVAGPLLGVAEGIEALARRIESGDVEAVERFIAAARERLARQDEQDALPEGADEPDPRIRSHQNHS